MKTLTKPKWRLEMDRKTNSYVFTEVQPPANDTGEFFRDGTERSRWTLKVTTPCYVGGNLASIGDTVICFSEEARSLRDTKRVKVISEEKNFV